MYVCLRTAVEDVGCWPRFQRFCSGVWNGALVSEFLTSIPLPGDHTFRNTRKKSPCLEQCGNIQDHGVVYLSNNALTLIFLQGITCTKREFLIWKQKRKGRQEGNIPLHRKQSSPELAACYLGCPFLSLSGMEPLGIWCMLREESLHAASGGKERTRLSSLFSRQRCGAGKAPGSGESPAERDQSTRPSDSQA